MNKSAEVDATRTMIDRVEERFDLTPDRLVGDTNYGSAAMLGWLVDEKQIEPHVPVRDKSERQNGTFSRSDFQWDEAGQRVPLSGRQGATLRLASVQNVRTHITKADAIIYRSSQRTARPVR